MRDHREAPRAVDQPQPGYFRMRFVRGGPYVGARIILYEDGMWLAEIDGQPQGQPNADPAQALNVFRIWLGGVRCNQEDHDYLVALAKWAREHDPTHPLAQPYKPISLASAKPLY